MIDELLHHFGVRAKAREQELHQRLVDSQAMQARLVKDVHELCQFVIMKLASCASRLDSLDGAMQNCCTEAAQTLANWEALEKRVAVTEDIMVYAGLHEVRANIQKRMRRYLLFGGIGRQQLSSCKNWIQRW